MNWQGLILVLETSASQGEIAIFESDKLIASQIVPDLRRQSNRLSMLIGELFVTSNRQTKDLSGVIVSLGPGSYTSLRVGMMTAKTFAYAVGCPCLGIDRFLAIAEEVRKSPAWHEMVLSFQDAKGIQRPNRLAVIEDALQKKIFCQWYIWQESKWNPDSQTEIVSIQTFIEELHENDLVVGPGLSTYGEYITHNKKTTLLSEFSHPRCNSYFTIAKKMESIQTREWWTMEPNYLRGSYAEEKNKTEEKNKNEKKN